MNADAEIDIPENAIVLVTSHGLGDTHLVAGLCHALKEKWPGFQITLVCKKEHRDLALMFPSIDLVASMDPVPTGQNETTHPVPGKTFYTHPSQALIRGDHCVAHRPMCDAAMYAMILGLDPNTRVALPEFPDECYLDASAIADRLEIRDIATVLLVPYANSWPNAPVAFWNELATALEAAGYRVLWNDHNLLPLHLVFPFLEQIDWVIGANCGFMQVAVLGQLDCRKTILHQALNGNNLGLPISSPALYANVRKIDGHKYDIEEFQVGGSGMWSMLIETIIRGRNATGPDPILTPLTTIEVETSPGDVIDRLTILWLKQAYLPAIKAASLQREIDLLLDVRYRLMQAYPDVAIHESELCRLNLIAWKNNQILIDEVVDGYGEGSWQLWDGDDIEPLAGVDELAKAQKVIKAFAAAHWANRARVAAKNQIDALCQAGTREEKTYQT